MIPATPELEALLETGEFVFADCFEIVLKDGLGTVIRLTEHDQDLALDGDAYAHAMVIGGKLKRNIGLVVDEQTIVWTPPSDYTVRGKAVRELVRKGLFDMSDVVQRRAFAPDWSSPVTGYLEWFGGIVTQAIHLGGSITFTVSSLLILLNANVPGPVYQAACRHVFGSPSCGINVPALAVNGVVAAGSSASSILCNLGQDDHYWDHGKVTMLSGDNQGLTRAVKTSAQGQLDLYGPFPYAPGAGDQFSITPGCDKTAPTMTLNKVTVTVPKAASISVATADTFGADIGVVLVGLTHVEGTIFDDQITVQDPNVTMTAVTGAPTEGQYQLNGNVYVFAAADIGRSVIISSIVLSGTDHGCGRYRNISSFGGEPYVPVPETGA